MMGVYDIYYTILTVFVSIYICINSLTYSDWLIFSILNMTTIQLNTKKKHGDIAF